MKDYVQVNPTALGIKEFSGNEGYANQATFPEAIHVHANEGRFEEHVVFDDPQRPRLLAHEDAAVRGDGHGGGAGKAGGQDLFRKSVGQVGAVEAFGGCQLCKGWRTDFLRGSRLRYLVERPYRREAGKRNREE